MIFIWILISTFLVSLVSLAGIIALGIRDKLLKEVIFLFIGFSAGTLIGSAFLHILPEALEKAASNVVFYEVILGLILFFLMERFFYWRHCHDGVCDVHAFTYLNLIGDGLHNFVDGMVIAVSFIVSLKIGIVTTLAVIFHEIPQELGDFGVLIYGGFTKQKALFFNFISALMAIVGAIAGYFISDIAIGFSKTILPLTAGGFIYIAACDLIPQIHKETSLRRSGLAFIFFLFGIVFMATVRILLKD